MLTSRVAVVCSFLQRPSVADNVHIGVPHTVLFLLRKLFVSATTDRLQPGEDNVPLGRLAHWTTQEIVEMGWEVLTHLLYSLDLAPSDFNLFGPLIWKNHLEVEFNLKTRMQYSNLDFKISMLQALCDLLSTGNTALNCTETHVEIYAFVTVNSSGT